MVLPWAALTALIEPHETKASKKGGRPPCPLATMLRIHTLQQWSSLSDPAMEEALTEVPTMRSIAGIELISDWIPDETTILTEWLHLDEGAARVGRRPKNRDCKRDLEMHQTKKGNQWSHCFAKGFAYGMKVHTGVDKDSGLIHSVAVTAANVHDLTPAADLLHGDEQVVDGDAGDLGIAIRPEMDGTKAEFRVAMRPGKWRALPDTSEGKLQDLIETAKAHIRAKVEHQFRVIKQQFGFQKTRLRGLALPRPQAERGGATGVAASPM